MVANVVTTAVLLLMTLLNCQRETYEDRGHSVIALQLRGMTKVVPSQLLTDDDDDVKGSWI